MYKKLYSLNTWKSNSEHSETTRFLVISGGEQAASVRKRGSLESVFLKRANRWLAFWFSAISAAVNWVLEARLVRQTAPGARALERHEFEAIELRRGGFGG